VYSVDVVSNIPDVEIIVKNSKDIISAIKGVRASSIRHDLIGRIYHESLPYETRKRLATFYTKPVAAEILAGLCIDKWNETVTDLACGSGTLLVAAYRRKETLYKEENKRESLSIGEIEKLHNAFTQEEITGFDIMPFAAHLTAVNLSAQTPHITTNKLRVAIHDSLFLQDSVRSTDFKGKGILLKPFSRTIQETLVKPEKTTKQTYFSRAGEVAEAKGAVSPQGIGEAFFIRPSDVIIMNPPFSDREKMPADYRDEIKKLDKLISKCGNQVNLWGDFLALADDMIKDGGKIGAVIPINIARGKATEKIRTYLFNKYHVRLLIKPVGDFAFSESSSFKDILFIAEKRKPTKEDLTTIVFLKKSIKDIDLDEAKDIVEKIKSQKIKESEIIENEQFSLKVVRQSELIKRLDNLMLFIGGTDFKNIDTLREFIDAVTEIGNDKMLNLDSHMLKEGITSPSGLGQLVYITRQLDESRVKRSFLILEKDGENLKVTIKDTDIPLKIPKNKTIPALRTLTGIKNLDITHKSDFIITQPYEDFKIAKTVSKWEGKFDWDIINDKIEKLGLSRLIIPDKIRLSSKNTFILSVYSEKPLVLSNLFFTYKDLDKDNCKILSISLNSVLTLAQFITLKAETLGGYLRLSAADWNLTSQIDYKKLKNNEKVKLLKLFDKIKDVEFPSIIDQLENKFWARMELDKIVLKILGLSDNKIDEYLPKIYNVLVNELKSISED
jgi:hypothetical protein